MAEIEQSEDSGKDMEFYVATIMALWFMISSWFWPYWAAIYISYPFGMIALMCYYKEKKRRPKVRYLKKVPFILIIGLIGSAIGLYFKMTN